MKIFLTIIVLICFSPYVIAKELNCFLANKNIKATAQLFTDGAEVVEVYDNIIIDYLNEDYDLNIKLFESKANNIIVMEEMKIISDFYTKLYPLTAFPDEFLLIYLVMLDEMHDLSEETSNVQINFMDISNRIISNNFTYDDVLKIIEKIYEKDFNINIIGKSSIGQMGMLETSLFATKIGLEISPKEEIIISLRATKELFDNSNLYNKGFVKRGDRPFKLDKKNNISKCYNTKGMNTNKSSEYPNNEFQLCLEENNSNNLKKYNFYKTFKDKKINDYSYIINYSEKLIEEIPEQYAGVLGKHNKILEKFYYGFCE